MSQGYEPWEVQTFTGTGNQVVRLLPLQGQFLLIFQTSPNAGYIGVAGVNQSGETTMFAVNTTDQYSGTTLWAVQGDPVVAFKVECAGGWSLAIRPLSDARVWEGADVVGTGPDVLVLDQPVSGFMTVAIHATSNGHTGVNAYSESDSYLLFNFVGPNQAETVLPAGVWIMSIDSDAPWSMARG
jgi:hypothetical protein